MSDSLEKVKATIPMISGSLSWIASSALILTILKSRERLSVTFHRIMVAMSLSDLVSSFAISLGGLPTPVSSNMWLASGNEKTCEVQGFFGTFTMATPLFNGMLCIHFLLSVKYGVSANIRKVIDPFLIIIPVMWGIFVGCYFLVTNAYNPHLGTKMCWITEFPFDCDKNPDVDCIRGSSSQHSFVYRTSLFLAFIVVPFAIIGSLSAIYFHLRREEESYQNRILVLGGQRLHTLPSLSRRSLYQLLAYSGAWFLSHIFYMIVYITSDWLKADISATIYFLLMFFYPLQGYLNFIVFIFPKVRAYRQRNPGICCFKAMINVMLNRTRSLPRHNQTLATAPGNLTSYFEENNPPSTTVQEFASYPVVIIDWRESKSSLTKEENTSSRGDIVSSESINLNDPPNLALNQTFNETSEEESFTPPLSPQKSEKFDGTNHGDDFSSISS
jgi:hypothetical protein